jgi:hypothetical protein
LPGNSHNPTEESQSGVGKPRPEELDPLLTHNNNAVEAQIASFTSSALFKKAMPHVSHRSFKIQAHTPKNRAFD